MEKQTYYLLLPLISFITITASDKPIKPHHVRVTNKTDEKLTFSRPINAGWYLPHSGSYELKPGKDEDMFVAVAESDTVIIWDKTGRKIIKQVLEKGKPYNVIKDDDSYTFEEVK